MNQFFFLQSSLLQNNFSLERIGREFEFVESRSGRDDFWKSDTSIPGNADRISTQSKAVLDDDTRLGFWPKISSPDVQPGNQSVKDV